MVGKIRNNAQAALEVIVSVRLPAAQQNERSALSLLALLNLSANRPWTKAQNPMLGITPIMDWVRDNYGKEYAPNTRESFRRQTMHQFCDAGLVVCNPDDPCRPINSPKTVYQVEPIAFQLLRSFGTKSWQQNLKSYIESRQTLVERYAKQRQFSRISVQVATDRQISLSPGEHSEMIRAVIEEFAPRFVPGSTLIYAGDTGEKWGYFEIDLLAKLGVTVDFHGKMPDVVLYFAAKNWLVLVESVTSHGPVNSKRHGELSEIFAESSAGIVYITTFPTRSVMSRFLADIAWETEVWVVDAPSHLIHFNGQRFLGPYAD